LSTNTNSGTAEWEGGMTFRASTIQVLIYPLYVISIYIVVLYALRVMMTAVSTVLTANVFHWYCVRIVYRPLGSN